MVLDAQHLGEGRVHPDVPAFGVVGDADADRRHPEQRLELALAALYVGPGRASRPASTETPRPITTYSASG